MSNTNHPVVTQDYPENKLGGIMICGINFGYSKADEKLEAFIETPSVEKRSFFSDSSVNNTRFRNRVLAWLSLWDIPIATNMGKEGAFERSFFQSNWLGNQTHSVTSDGDISSDVLVKNADGVLDLMHQRKPAKIILIGAMLIEALNDIRLRARVECILGPRSGNAAVLTAPKSAMHKKYFKIYSQSFGKTRILCLPHVQARGLTDEYMASFKLVAQDLLLSA